MVIIKVSSTWKLGRRVWILRGYVRNKHYELLTALHTYWKNSMRNFIYLPILALAENEWESKTIDRAHLFIEGQTWNEDLIVWQNTEECYHCTWVRSGLQWRVIFGSELSWKLPQITRPAWRLDSAAENEFNSWHLCRCSVAPALQGIDFIDQSITAGTGFWVEFIGTFLPLWSMNSLRPNPIMIRPINLRQGSWTLGRSTN